MPPYSAQQRTKANGGFVVSRRGVLAGAAVAALGTLTTAGEQAATAAVTVPAPRAELVPVARTIVRRRSLAGQMRVPKLQAGATHLAVRWHGDSAHIRLRTENGWTAFTQLDECGGAPDNRPATTHSALLTVPGTTGYEVVVSGGGTADVSEINTVDGPTVATATVPIVGMPLPDGSTCPVTYLSRAAWGADESLRFTTAGETWPAEWWPAQALTVHHTASANGDPNPAATVRAIYFDQCINKGWGDIGYHLLIDEAGRVYEGRWSGDEQFPIFGPGTQKLMNTAGHAETFNTGNIGIVLIGLFTDVGPTAAARAALVTVLASLARMLNINPVGTVNYVNPVNGNTNTVRGVSGHRDWNPTQCPGNTFYPSFEDLRNAVAAQIPRSERVREDPPPVQPLPIPDRPRPSSPPIP
jgi:N-acetylmuramoyl-L-alanine amidase